VRQPAAGGNRLDPHQLDGESDIGKGGEGAERANRHHQGARRIRHESGVGHAPNEPEHEHTDDERG
jgi:hypothetical protein